MTFSKLSDMKGGWFIGNFTPTLISTKDFEIAIKEYAAGTTEPTHYHKCAREITVVISGTVSFNSVQKTAGDIIEVEMNEIITFKAITDAKTVVVKIPSVKDDKYTCS